MVVTLPYSRVVDVTVTRQDRFATREGFGVLLLLISEEKTGVLDTTFRTKLYSTIQEVATDWSATSEPYKAASRLFQQSPRPKQMKMGYRDATADITDEMNAIVAFDPDWYWLTHTKELNDTSEQQELSDWAETQNILLGADSNDPDTEDLSNTTCIAYYAKNKGYDRTAVFYHTNPDSYQAIGAFTYGARRNLDQGNFDRAIQGDLDSGQAYTLKFKKIAGVEPLDKASSIVQIITGFVPDTGLNPAQGHLANTYVNIGGLNMIVEGNVSSGAFIDEIHSLDWIRARIQEEVLSRLANNARIPYTNPGMAILIGGVNEALNRGVAAGIIAGDIEDGEYKPEYTVSADRVENIPASQRRQRIAPDIQATFRYAGAFHYASVNVLVQF